MCTADCAEVPQEGLLTLLWILAGVVHVGKEIPAVDKTVVSLD